MGVNEAFTIVSVDSMRKPRQDAKRPGTAIKKERR